MSYDGRLLAGVTVLMTVVEAGSMVRAAEALRLSPSGVGRAISRLETRLGVKLLERTTRSMRLTDEGMKFYERIAPLVDDLEEAAREASSAAATVSGNLRINTDLYIAQAFLSNNLSAFISAYPRLNVELLMRDSVADMIANGFDLALRMGAPPDGPFIAHKLMETRILTVASPDYIARRGRPVHPDEIAQHDIISYWDAGQSKPYEMRFQKDGQVIRINPRCRLISSDGDTVLLACASGVGISQVLELGVKDYLDQGRFVEVLADWSRYAFPMYMIYPRRYQNSKKVRAFAEFILNLVRLQDEQRWATDAKPSFRGGADAQLGYAD